MTQPKFHNNSACFSAFCLSPGGRRGWQARQTTEVAHKRGRKFHYDFVCTGKLPCWDLLRSRLRAGARPERRLCFLFEFLPPIKVLLKARINDCFLQGWDFYSFVYAAGRDLFAMLICLKKERDTQRQGWCQTPRDRVSSHDKLWSGWSVWESLKTVSLLFLCFSALTFSLFRVCSLKTIIDIEVHLKWKIVIPDDMKI